MLSNKTQRRDPLTDVLIFFQVKEPKIVKQKVLKFGGRHCLASFFFVFAENKTKIQVISAGLWTVTSPTNEHPRLKAKHFNLELTFFAIHFTSASLPMCTDIWIIPPCLGFVSRAKRFLMTIQHETRRAKGKVVQTNEFLYTTWMFFFYFRCYQHESLFYYFYIASLMQFSAKCLSVIFNRVVDSVWCFEMNGKIARFLSF